MFYLAWRIDARATIIKIIKLSYRRLCSAGEVHARNGCIENVALICLHSAPHFFFLPFSPPITAVPVHLASHVPVGFLLYVCSP